MVEPHHSPTPTGGSGATVVFTDGACSGNPGPGGWAWVSRHGEWAAGFDPDTTNQRMELTAVIEACEAHEGPLHVVSDSTYVVNCWRDRWWQGWLKRAWKNSRREPVANRDLWELLVPHFRDREELTLEWVKGHSGEHLNELADRLAVGAVQRRGPSAGTGEPPAEVLGVDGRRTAAPQQAAQEQSRSARRRSADPRVPEGHLLVVTGSREPDAHPDLRGEMRRILEAKAQLHSDLVVLTGLRRGAETVAADAALDASVRYVVVLPYPDPVAGWPERETSEFLARLGTAESVVTLEKQRPGDLAGRRSALDRRDGWLRSVADEAIVVTDPADDDSVGSLRRWEKALGDELWVLEVPGGAEGWRS
ncbi:MAG: ribonuclease HI [Microthrixaceae bacterium]|nr:ribonuclease HI [Microthrixaceae bacterium]